jgi:hypothetical protein
VIVYCDASKGRSKKGRRKEQSHGLVLGTCELDDDEVKRSMGLARQEDMDGVWILAVCRRHGFRRVREAEVRAAILAGRRSLAMQPYRVYEPAPLWARVLARLTP